MSIYGKDILVVDDAPDSSLILKNILEGDGARVFEADSVSRAVELSKTKAPQLVLLDLELPGRSVFELLDARKNEGIFRDVPVLILSEKSDPATVAEAIALGASDYILKPIRATLLLQKVRKALRLTSFLTRKFDANDAPKATFTLEAELVGISEGGCQISTGVRMAPNDLVTVTGEALNELGVQALTMKVGRKPPGAAGQGRYATEIHFVGLSHTLAKKVRKLLKT